MPIQGEPFERVTQRLNALSGPALDLYSDLEERIGRMIDASPKKGSWLVDVATIVDSRGRQFPEEIWEVWLEMVDTRCWKYNDRRYTIERLSHRSGLYLLSVEE